MIENLIEERERMQRLLTPEAFNKWDASITQLVIDLLKAQAKIDKPESLLVGS